MEQRSPYVIVGASLAGAKAAEALRDAGYDGPLVLIGDEPSRPYERPGLSKGVLLGTQSVDKLFVHDAGWYAEHQVDLRLETRVVGLDRATHHLELAGGERLGYGKVLLATGSRPRRLDVPGSDLGGIAYLRRREDSEALRDLLTLGGRVVVVGGGWIGLEVAAAARHHGCDVTLIEPQPAPLHAVLGQEVGEAFARLHREHGVDLRTGLGVEGFERDGATVSAVRTSDGQRVDGDLVVVGVGIVPNVELASESGLEVDNGILVDEELRTSDPDVFAAGDVANALHPLLGTRVRVEHWANAANQGAAAGRSMAGQGEPYARLPYFFTDQYDLSMEYHGHAGRGEAARVVLRGDPGGDSWLAFWLDRDGRVLAGMNVNDWDAAAEIKRLTRQRAVVDPVRLGDPHAPLTDL